ncbi:MAG: response regulator [Anaerolineaceae bacterium]|nr:response regulator [Anaerolineaceae bacterium]
MANEKVDRTTFNEIIKDVLSNLFDVSALETHPVLFSVIQPPTGYVGNKGEYVRQLIFDAIEQLRPLRKEESINSPEWRPYQIMYKRYVEGMGLQELSDLLAVSPRQMRRDHHKALMALSEILWAWCFPASAKNEPADPQANPIIEIHNEVIDPLETTRGVYQMLKRRFDDKGIGVNIRSADEPMPLITDRVVLRQALIGLFNDCLHIQSGPLLTVTVQAVKEEVVIQITTQVNLKFEPAGEGEEDDGLNAVRYWCSRINARLDETVNLENGAKWAKRSLWLPRSNQKIVLVIDDQSAVLNMFRRYLSQTNLLLVGVEDPKQALNLAKRLQPALITLDVMMPQMDGWELLQLLKLDEQVHHIPIIVCSAWDDPNLSRNLGAAAFLKKPVTQKMLLEVVDQFVSPD